MQERTGQMILGAIGGIILVIGIALTIGPLWSPFFSSEDSLIMSIAAPVIVPLGAFIVMLAMKNVSFIYLFLASVGSGIFGYLFGTEMCSRIACDIAGFFPFFQIPITAGVGILIGIAGLIWRFIEARSKKPS